jgi:hypothetical protein
VRPSPSTPSPENTFQQRFDSARELSVHVHTSIFEGVYFDLVTSGGPSASAAARWTGCRGQGEMRRPCASGDRVAAVNPLRSAGKRRTIVFMLAATLEGQPRRAPRSNHRVLRLTPLGRRRPYGREVGPCADSRSGSCKAFRNV